jgi:hypothetical protein
MPERTAALQEVAQAVEHVGVSVDQLIGELRAARDKTHEELNGIRRLGWMVLVGLTILTILSVIGAYTLYLVNDTISPGGDRFKQGQARTAQVLVTLATEGDCRNRRSAAGLPASDPRVECAKQTPAEVYPGVAAEMPPRPNG